MKTKEGRVRNIGFSLVSKLNIQLWIRLLGLFLALNLLFLVTAAVALVFVGEKAAADVAHRLGQEDLTAARFEDAAFVEVKVRHERARGFLPPAKLRAIFPTETGEASRSFLLPVPEDVAFYHLFDALQFRLDLSVREVPYSIVVHLSSYVWVLKIVFLVVLAGQLILALKSIVTRADLIKKILQPISELAKQAQSLSTGQGPLTLAEMDALAGTLDEINAARLDTRIDLTDTQDELKNVAAAINGLLDRINESYRLQARFVSDASHELRSPIAAIQGYANLLDRWGKHDQEALQESIDAIKEEAANMKDLVEQLLFLARGDNHTMSPQRERFDLGGLAKVLWKETQMINGGHRLELATAQAYVLGDASLIKQAGRILIDNAIKYTPVGGHIRIFTEANNGMARLSVQDTGIGIPAEAIPHIFERFYRADESRARATGGAGLGLSIAKWIVERHGGHLEVVSREELGSRFSLVLPENRT